MTYTAASTGTAGTDYTAPYTASNGLLTIAMPNSSGTISIATLTDDLLDPGETLSVTLTAADTAIGAVDVGDPATATTTIAEQGTVTVSVKPEEVEDDDSTQDVNEYEDKSIVEEGRIRQLHSGTVRGRRGDGHSRLRDLERHRRRPMPLPGPDYTVASGKLTFNSGQPLTQPLTVTTADDSLNEPTEKFTITLTAQDLPDLVSIGTSSKQGTITDNDGLEAAVTAVADSVDEGETAEFEVALSGGTSTRECTGDLHRRRHGHLRRRLHRPGPPSRSRSAVGIRAAPYQLRPSPIRCWTGTKRHWR